MKFYLRILLAGLMGLPAADGLRHGDVWLCCSFAAGAAFVFAANCLFGEAAAPETVDETGFRSGGAGAAIDIVSGHIRTNYVMLAGQLRRQKIEILRHI